jgi:hypothetical protein
MRGVSGLELQVRGDRLLRFFDIAAEVSRFDVSTST